MQQPLRYLSFLILSFAILIGWHLVIVPRFFPPLPPQAAQPAEKKVEPKPAQVAEQGVGAKDPQVAADPAAKPDAENAPDADNAPEAEKPPEAPAVAAKPTKFPPQIVKLGALDADSGYRQFVSLTSRGAAVAHIELNDPLYRELDAPEVPLRVVGNGASQLLTLQTTVPEFGADLNSQDWEVVPDSQTQSEVTFRMRSPDGQLEVLKHYALGKVDPQNAAAGYELKFDLTFRNLGSEARTLQYTLQGPVGLPLENVDNTAKFRDVVVGFVEDDGSVSAKILSGKTIAGGDIEEWKRPLKYIGVDVQYFASLILPQGNQLKSSFIESSTQMRVGADEKEKSDISITLTSNEISLPAADNKPSSVTHSYELFSGPKRDEVLDSIGAGGVIEYGWFGWISKPMLALLKTFYALFGNFGIAIVCLTVVVRLCMFPLSIKQARSAAKMQEIQPELAALKEKYGKDKEKMARAQMELFSKHNYNPLGGCLLVFLQLPVFMGLYQALNHSVDLRMAPFLWINNLAAPDALFELPFRVPFVGWDQFNLLPLITIVLFIVQQKMFMPPPTNDEQAMQQKMMNYMMIFMGFLFYRVPAGLCVYFIASSLWGLAERKFLPKAVPQPPTAGGPNRPDGKKKGDSGPDSKEQESTGLMSMLLKAAEKETSLRKPSPGKRK